MRLFRNRLSRTTLISLFLLLISSIIFNVAGSTTELRFVRAGEDYISDFQLFVYGTSSCISCSNQEQILRKLFGNESVFIYDISQKEYALALIELYQLFPEDLRKPYSGGLCPSCIAGNAWGLEIPVTGVIYGGHLIGIVISVYDEEFWRDLSANATHWRSPHVFSSSGSLTIENDTLTRDIQVVITGGFELEKKYVRNRTSLTTNYWSSSC